MIAAGYSVYRLILPEFRLRFAGLVAMSLVVAMLEMVGVASVMPLIAVMVDPSGLSRSQGIGKMLAAVGFGKTAPPLHIVGLITIGLFVLANAAGLFLNWWSVNFAARLAVALSEAFARSHFRRPFVFFMAHSPAELANHMCNEVAKVALGGVLQLCLVVVRVVQLLLVLAILLLISPWFSIVFFSLMAALYGLIYRHSSARIEAAGAIALRESSRAMHAATEMYSLAREILLRGESRYFVDRVCVALDRLQRADVTSRVLPSVPKYALELAAVCAFFALPIYRSLIGEDVRPELPILATFAYAGFRLLPVIQQLYSSITLLNFHQPVAERLLESLAVPTDVRAASDSLDRMPATIEFKDVSYRYPQNANPAVAHASLSIARGERVVVVGPSGAGKSTLVDLVLGLLTPDAGSILVDGAPSPVGRLAWRTGMVGYVPQAPFIMNDTIARNIAFGLAEAEIDFARCREAAVKAGIIELIEAQPKQLDAVIGVDVLNFSGGERQRLAIARALYSSPAVLALDEPVSALDPPTSRKIFELLCAPKLGATVIVITHDLEYLPLFDKVVFMQDGAVVMAGSFEHLLRNCPAFRSFQNDLVRNEQPVAVPQQSWRQ